MNGSLAILCRDVLFNILYLFYILTKSHILGQLHPNTPIPIQLISIRCAFMGGRGRPCSPDWLRQISKPIRGARPPTKVGGQGRPNSASHIFSCDLSEPIRASHGLPLRPPTASHSLPLRPPTSNSQGLPPRTPTASHLYGKTHFLCMYYIFFLF